MLSREPSSTEPSHGPLPFLLFQMEIEMTTTSSSVPLISSPFRISCTEHWGKGDNVFTSDPPLLEAYVGSTGESIPLLHYGSLSLRLVQ